MFHEPDNVESTPMRRQGLNLRDADAKALPFSQAVVVSGNGSLVFVSGLTSREPGGRVVGRGDVRLQTRNVLDIMAALLTKAGGTLDDVVKLTIYVRDAAHAAAINEVRRDYFRSVLPASSMVEVARLLDDALLIEMDAIAIIASDAR